MINFNQKNHRRAATTIEYVLLVTCVIAGLIVFLKPRTGPLATKLNGVLEKTTDGITNVGDRLPQVWKASP